MKALPVCFTALLSLCFAIAALAQSPAVDTLPGLSQAMLGQEEAPKHPNWFQQDYPSPKKAALLSLALPGAGQVYNKRWWKVPFVYGAMVGMGITIDYNQDRYRRLRDALELKRDNLPHEFSGTSLDNTRALRSLRDEFDKNTQLAYVGLVIVYGLQAMEAFVDAHLKGFDVNDDLGGIRLKPTAEYYGFSTAPAIGLGLSIPIQSGRGK